jgi:hypothetical protein
MFHPCLVVYTLEFALQMALDLRSRNGGQAAYFSNPLISAYLPLVQSQNPALAGKSLVDIKQEILKDGKVLDHLVGNAKARALAQNTQSKLSCSIL